MKTKSTLILGLGNEILSDDGIGPRLVNDLSDIFGIIDTDYIAAGSGGFEIMELISGYKKVMIIDSIHTTSGKPGDVYLLKTSDFKKTSNLSGIHDVNFLASLELGKVLGYTMPDEIHIIAVEILEDMEFGERFTPALEVKYPEILKKVTNLVKGI